MKDIAIISGNSNLTLSNRICEVLDQPLVNTKIGQFSDGESEIEINSSLKGKNIFVIQSTSKPANHNIMELYLMLDAIKRAQCGIITAVVPYFGYARQDKKIRSRVPISAKAIADMLIMAGTDRILTFDLHSSQIQGFFNCPVDNLYASPLFIKDIKDKYYADDIVVVSPDTGGTDRAKAYAKMLGCDIAIIYKKRCRPNQLDGSQTTLIGEVDNKYCIIIDDMIDTAGTLCQASEVCYNNGAVEVSCYATHAVMSGPCYDRLEESNIKNIIVTDTIEKDQDELPSIVQTISVKDMLAEAINRIHLEKTLSSMFEY